MSVIQTLPPLGFPTKQLHQLGVDHFPCFDPSIPLESAPPLDIVNSLNPILSSGPPFGLPPSPHPLPGTCPIGTANSPGIVQVGHSLLVLSNSPIISSAIAVPSHPAAEAPDPLLGDQTLVCNTGLQPQARIGLDPSASQGALFHLVFSLYGDMIRREVARRYRRINHRIRRYVDRGDLVQETNLELRKFIQTKPMELFIDREVCRRLMSVLVQRATSRQVRLFGSAKRNFRRAVQATDTITDQLPSRENHNVLDRMIEEELSARCLKVLDTRRGQVIRLRVQGNSWKAVSQETGLTPDGARMLFNRAMQELREYLGAKELVTE